jgi:hypothetical protein
MGNTKQKTSGKIIQGSFYIFFILLTLGLTHINNDNLNYFLKTSGNRPYGIAFDNKGAMFIVTAPETGNGMLSKVNPDGKITNLAVIVGNFIGPGICFDNDNNILITAGEKLLKVSLEGKCKIIADGFSRCFDVKVDKNNIIYVADDLQGTIYRINSSGTKNIFYKSDTVGSFVLTSIILDKNNENLYARDGNKILKFNIKPDSTSRNPQLIIDNIKMFYLCIDSNNVLYASTLDNVIKINPGGKVEYLSQKALGTSLGLAAGGKGFDENFLYVTVEDGIVQLPIPK